MKSVSLRQTTLLDAQHGKGMLGCFGDALAVNVSLATPLIVACLARLPLQ